MSTDNNNTKNHTLEDYYSFSLKLIMQCGPLLREGFEKAKSDYKTKTAFFDIVTVYDDQLEKLIIENLSKEFPESKFIGEEEQAASEVKAVLTDDPTWIIDPIDGTTNFVHRIPMCCISLGLAINKELVLGIVYNPCANELFSAWKGHGAFLNGQPIHVSQCKTINDSVTAYEISLIHAPDVRDKNVKRLCTLASNSTGTRCIGSAALTLCYLAMGRFDCYHVEDLKPWDIAGGAVIIREAGGIIRHTRGGDFDIMKPDLVSAATPELLQDVIQLIEKADQLTDFEFK